MNEDKNIRPDPQEEDKKRKKAKKQKREKKRKTENAAENTETSEASGTAPAEDALEKDAEADNSETDEKKKKSKKKRSVVSTLLLILIFLVGLGVLLYPTFSNWWNSMHSSRAIASYVEAVEDLSGRQKEELLEAARAFNKKLAKNGIHFRLTDKEKEEYYSLLDIAGNGIMGYIQIPAIGVYLPVYHGTGEAVLQIAAGHLEGTSLPIGGESTHAAISGHRGLPSARLFTDLDRMREGDIFTVTVFDQTVTYQVDQIRIVLPSEVEEISIEKGEDYCTLITCTPYGVNTHRMLVRGHRIENLVVDNTVVIADAVKMPNYIAMLAVGIPLMLIIQIITLIYFDAKRPRRTYRELLDEFENPENSEK